MHGENRWFFSIFPKDSYRGGIGSMRCVDFCGPRQWAVDPILVAS